MFSIAKKELHQFFISLTGYITIVLFLLVNGLFLFVLKDSNIFDFGYATLDKFFELAPWIFLFLIPAITMRSLADEFKTGTFEILQTRPLTKWQIILGKYFAIIIVILFSLLPTLVYVVTIKSLSAGGIDSGGITGSYIGLIFLAAVFSAIGLCCSGFTNNAVIAFLISAFGCLVLYFGFNAISQLPVLQGKADYYVEMLGIDFHYRSISRGVIDTRDIIYFLSIIYFFLLLAVKNLAPLFWRGVGVRSWIPVIIILLLLNFVASQIHKRIDLTNEKRFTISSPVKKLLGNLDDVVTIDIFLKGEFPSGFKKLATSADELLQEFKEYSSNNIQYRFISPEEKIEGTERTYADTLVALGVQPINLKVQLKAGEQTQFIFPAALVHYKDKVQTVTLYPGTKMLITPQELNSAEALMEYKFANAIEQLTHNNKPMIAYSYGNGEPTGISTYDLVENVLKKNYNLFTINIFKEPVIPDTFKLLMIVKPSIPFTEDEKIKIDQYVMHGGKVIWFLDRLNAEMDSLQLQNQVIAYDRNLNLEDLLFNYGVRINPDLLMDLQSDFLPFDVNGNKQFEFLHWNYFPLFESKSNHVINKNIGLVAGRFVNSIDTVKAAGIRKIILLSSSANARTIATPALISGEENRNAPEDEQFKKKDIIAGVLLEGKFKSLYANRLPLNIMDTLQQYGTPFQTTSITDNKMIVISDGDIVLNGVSQGQPLPMGVNAYTTETQYQYQFANRDFLQNCLDYLINNSGLAEAKSKDYTLRLLDPKKIKEERTQWQIINIVLPVLLIFVFGFIYQYVRRRKYSV